MEIRNDYKNKVIVITGGASGFGLALGKQFAAEGAKVMLADMNEAGVKAAAEAIAADGHTCSWTRADVTKQADWDRLLERTLEEYGAADVLFNNAGIMGVKGFDALSDEDWRWAIDANLMSCVRGIRTFKPVMKSQPDGGKIVITSSHSALSPTATIAYTVTKIAAMRLAESCQVEATAKGEKVSYAVIMPAYMWTNIPCSEDYCPDDYDIAPMSPEDAKKADLLKMLGENKDSDRGRMTGGIEPEVAAERVIEQLKKDFFYIYTHRTLSKIVIMDQATRLLKGFEYPQSSMKVKDEYYKYKMFRD